MVTFVLPSKEALPFVVPLSVMVLAVANFVAVAAFPVQFAAVVALSAFVACVALFAVLAFPVVLIVAVPTNFSASNEVTGMVISALPSNVVAVPVAPVPMEMFLAVDNFVAVAALPVQA
nr:MAG TPA: hypothetical protein [Caudoviricetes sp.]